MINLIPETAKRKLFLEYWIRAVSVWGVVWSVALLVSAALLLPTYVLISTQIGVFAASAEEASQKVAAYDDVAAELGRASVQSRQAIDSLRQPQLSAAILKVLETEGQSVTVNSVVIARDGARFEPISISGQADDRQSLASFRDALLELPWVVAVDLPISNLAQDRDISFTLSVGVAEQITL